MYRWVILSLFIFTNVHAKELAVTIDDLPVAWSSQFSHSEQKEIFNGILRILQKHHVKIVGFTIADHIKSYNRELLDELVAQGHEVGNHTNTHPDFNELTIKEFEFDIVLAQNKLIPWKSNKKYFRYPMLHRGQTKLKRDAIVRFLKKNNFITSPVSIDNDDWKYNRDYINASKKGDLIAAKNIAEEYLTHMRERTSYFEKLSKDKIGRDIKHILLLHMNYINYKNLDTLLSWFKDEKWDFITLEEALNDPVYQLPDKYIGPNGISWLERI